MRRENFRTLEAEIGKIRDQLHQMSVPKDTEARALLTEARQFVAEIEVLLRRVRRLSGTNRRPR